MRPAAATIVGGGLCAGDAGCCFRTERGIRAFGDEGCRDIADGLLSARQRWTVAEIQDAERRHARPR